LRGKKGIWIEIGDGGGLRSIGFRDRSGSYLTELEGAP
jgi:hypothetical protein